MEGIINIIRMGRRSNKKYGFITSDNGGVYYFDSRYIEDGFSMDEYHENDKVAFSVIKQENNHDLAKDVKKIMDEPIKFYRPGNFLRVNRVDKKKIYDVHLKKNSGEREVLDKLEGILYVTHVNHHDTGHNTIFPFCLVGATRILKQYIRGQYEFLLVFSHFDNEDWQQSTTQAAKFIRQRKEISERRPLVNFYMLVTQTSHIDFGNKALINAGWDTNQLISCIFIAFVILIASVLNPSIKMLTRLDKAVHSSMSCMSSQHT